MLNVPRVHRISLVGKEKVYGGSDLLKSQVLSSEWKTERVREDASGVSEDGEEDDDELPCVIGESEWDCWLKLDLVHGRSPCLFWYHEEHLACMKVLEFCHRSSARCPFQTFTEDHFVQL